MKRSISFVLFPYLVPVLFTAIVCCTTIIFIPAPNSKETGPTGSGVLGLYGLIVAIPAAVIVQLFGCFLNTLFLYLRSETPRMFVACSQAMIPIAFILFIGEKDFSVSTVITISLTVAFFIGGAFLAYRNIAPNLPA